MAYNYISQKILDIGFDLNQILPDKQTIAQEQNNVSWNLFDIAVYLQAATEDFTTTQSKFTDIDNAISQIIVKHYNLLGKPNPFLDEAVIDQEVTLREPYKVKDGKTEKRGGVKLPVPKQKIPVIQPTPIDAAPVEVAPPIIEAVESDYIKGIKDTITFWKYLLTEEYDAEIIGQAKEKKTMEEFEEMEGVTAEREKEINQGVTLLKEFIEENEKV